MKRADAIWNKGPELIDDDGEVRELTKEDFATMVPFSELPADLRHVLSEIQKGNVTTRPDEEKVAVPVSRSVVERFRVTGSGWEGRVDEALRDWLDRQQDRQQAS